MCADGGEDGGEKDGRNRLREKDYLNMPLM
jgi:hypothetical protein